MTAEQAAAKVIYDYFTGRGAELALPLEDHAANIASDLKDKGILITVNINL